MTLPRYLKKSLLLLTIGLVSACATHTASSPEADVYYQYESAMNRGDLEGMMMLVAEDATFNNPGRCKPNPCQGKTIIRAFIKETAVDVAGRIKTLNVTSTPGALNARLKFTSTKVRGSGIDRILGNEIWKVSGGKITAFEFDIDRADKQSMAYIGSLQHAAAQAAARLAQPSQPKP